MESEYNLGTGILTWTRRERMSDRYGTVFLVDESIGGVELNQDVVVNEDEIRRCECVEGELIAEIVESRESAHVGDWFHGLAQQEVKEEEDEVVLGSGEFHVADGRWVTDDGTMDPVGVWPDDGSDSHLLEVEELYNVHDSTVRLLFRPRRTKH